MKPVPQKLSSLLRGFGAKLPKGSSDPLVGRLAIDSRRATPGSLFFALPGKNVDGNAFIDEAIQRGSVAVVSSQSRRIANPRVAFAKVADPRRTLAKVARRFFGEPDRELALVGVTGTNGKTTVAGLARRLLERPGRPFGCLGTVGYDLVERSIPSFRTTPEAPELCELLAQMKGFGCAGAVMEVSSHGIDQLRVAELEFDAMAFLNLTRDHLDYHGDMESYFAVKRRAFDGSVGPPPRAAAVNVDDPYGRRLAAEISLEGRLVRFGLDPRADVVAERIDLGMDGSDFDLVWPEGRRRVRSAHIGRYNVSNALAAFALCYALGEEVGESVERLKGFRGIPGRMEQVERGQDFKVVVDYAHTEDALRNALGMLREITPGRLLLVFGCGGNRDRGKRPGMTRAAVELADRVWATADNPRREPLEQIFADMRGAVRPGEPIGFVPDRRRAIEQALRAAVPGDCVLIAGKGHESFQEFGETVVTFDDRMVAGELLELDRLRGGARHV